MALTGQQAYALSKKTIQDITQGITMIEGKPCTVQSVSPITGGHRVTFKWTADDGTTKTDTMDVMDGSAGPQGPKGDTGNTGATGPAGAAGANGQAATIQVGTVTSGESAGVTNIGTSQNAVFNFTLPKGDKGDKGDRGADGENGSSFSIRARFSTEEELIAAYPEGPDNPGDAYFVGTTASPDLYVWLIDDEEWHNNGPIAGVKGDKGDTGDDGFSPVASVQKVGSITTITVRDKTGSTSATVNDGADGQNVADGNDGDSAYDIAVDEGFVGNKTEWLASLKGDPGTNGTNGQNGADGISPVANVTKTNGNIKIHIEDASGTTEEVIDMSDYASASDVSTINSKIPSTASSSNKMATASDIESITDKIPSNASSSNKLTTKDDIVTRHDYSITGTTDAVADTKTLVNHIITLGIGTYAGEFKRSGITFGSYRLTYLIDGTYSKSVSGLVTYSINVSTDATYQVSYVEDIEHGTPPEWKIEKFVTEDNTVKILPSATFADMDALLADLKARGSGVYKGMAFLSSASAWYDYDVSIIIGLESYWYGIGNLCSNEGTEYYIYKTYSTANVWTIQKVVTESDLPVKYLYVDGAAYTTLNDLLAVIIAYIGQAALSNGSAGVFNGVWTGKSHFSVQWVGSSSAPNWNGWFSLTFENAVEEHSIYSISIINSAISSQRAIV